jgi:hypothetical protein
MHTRPLHRTAMALVVAAAVLALAATPAAAAKPVKPTPPGDVGTDERPLTSEEVAAAERKIAAAEAFVASSVEGSGDGTVTLSCVTPTSTARSDALGATPDACYVPQSYLPVEARDQIRWYYCGPAVGQVIANYSWAVRSGANKYTQGTIADWMRTDVNGATNAYDLASGLNVATSSSPRRPSNFAYLVTALADTDRDGTVGDQFHDYVRAAVSSWKMPLAVSVKPHSPTSAYNLYSWPNPVASGGHWIAAYGWYGYWTGSTFARTYYTDSSRDEGGSTGKFWNPTLHIAQMIMEHTGRFVW